MLWRVDEGSRSPDSQHECESKRPKPSWKPFNGDRDQPESGQQLGSHQGKYDQSDARDMCGLVSGKGITADVGEQWIVDDLDGPDKTAKHGGTDNMND